MKEYIKIRGARVNNLQNVDVDIPLRELTCFFGPSGSGKTSIAFHTLYTESKRRFLNSFPTYLKFFSDRPAPVDVDEIFPVLPVFGLPQINPVVGTRSNIADIMHLTELLQNHFYHYSQELCKTHFQEFSEFKFSQYIAQHLSGDDGEVYHLLVKSSDFMDFFESKPFPSRSIKSKRSKKVLDFDQEHEFWEVIRFKEKTLNKLDEKVEEYLNKGIPLYIYSTGLNKVHDLAFKLGLKKCDAPNCKEVALKEKSILNFSPYNALGACSECGGFGETLDYDRDKLVDMEKSVKDEGVILLNYKRFGDQKEELKKVLKKKKISLTKPISELKEDFWEVLYAGEGSYQGFDAYFRYLERKKYKMNVRIFLRNIQKGSSCGTCHGTRLQPSVGQFFIDQTNDLSLDKFMNQSLLDCLDYLKGVKDSLYMDSKESKKSYKKVLEILEVANSIGLGHLKLLRKAKTVSAGEYQRLLLLKYLSYDGTGALFVFDEPSLGLSEKEMKSLLKAFRELIKKGNSVIIIDHNEYFKKQSDYLIEVGPGAGHYGGKILFEGERKLFKFKDIKNPLKPIKVKKREFLELKKPTVYGRKYKDIKIPINEVSWIKGSSGTGKTSVLINTLAAHLHYLKEGKHLNLTRGSFEKLKGNSEFNDIIIVDANLNRYTSRSTVGSMTGFFPVVRKHYSNLSVSKSLGLVDGNFSFNSDLGQCPKCEGKGVLTVEMQFLEDIVLECEDCRGKKLKPIYADIHDGNMTVHEAFSRPVSEVLSNIKLTPKFQRINEYLKILNLEYLSLDRQINSLSGGEKQRIYLLSKLQKSLTDSVIFFENISFGLSKLELINLCEFLQKLSMKNNTIVIIDQDQNFVNIAGHTIEFD
jgi:excinuclease ABC subunit A